LFLKQGNVLKHGVMEFWVFFSEKVHGKKEKKKIKKIGKKRVKRSQLCCKSEKIRGQWGVLWL